MSWLLEDAQITWFQRFCMNILKVGPIPRHLAVIMDGNRRYARKNDSRYQFGHNKGFHKLSETLQWCFHLGITEVTVYAFSIENFKRSAEEVDNLMEMVREKYKHLLEEKDKLMNEGVCIRVIGNLSLLPPDIRKSIAEVMIMTKNNNKLFFNVALAYTSTDEITNAISTVATGVRTGLLEERDIDENLLTSCLYTSNISDPDLLIRTSGETRLSDFLLWQIEHSNIYFADVLWPEFSIWHLIAAVFMYQRNLLKKPEAKLSQKTDRSQKFLQSVQDSRWADLDQYVKAEV